VSWAASRTCRYRADHDGDGKADIAVYRDGAWYILRSGVQIAVGWEAIGDIGKLTFLPRGVTSHIDRAVSSSSFLATILIFIHREFPRRLAAIFHSI
jgi:hypothetical protein